MWPKPWLLAGGLCLAGTPFVLAQTPGQPAPGCQKLANEFYTVELCPAAIPPIAQVRIEATTPRGKGRPGEDCTTFRPSVSALHRFWAQAGQLSSQDYMHALEQASCGAGGTMVLGDGRKATWNVSASRMGTLHIEGEPEEKALHLFCPDCNFAPFWDWNTDADFLPIRK